MRKAIRFNLIDSGIALNLAFFVNAAILVLAGTAFYQSGNYHISDIQDAHLLLSNLFGTLAPALFAIALIAAGQSSTITGTLAGQIIMEGYLHIRFSPWIRRLVTRLLAIAPALFTIYVYGDNRMGDLLVLSQVVLSMQLGFAVIPLIHFTANRKWMGVFAIRKHVVLFASICAIVIVVLNALLVYEEAKAVFISDVSFWVKVLLSMVICYTLILLLYITFHPWIDKIKVEKTPVKMHKALTHFEVPVDKRYQCIAIAVDFGKSDNITIQQALQMGGKQTRYLLLHVVESAGALKMRDDINDAESKLDLQMLSHYTQELTALGYQVEAKLGYGKSGQALIKLVNESSAELLVLGSHGHSGISDFVFGTTADVVRHGVKIPVLIVK
jgi:manganese transport protein